MNLKFYTSVAKGLKRVISPFVEVIGKKLVGGRGGFLHHILNRANERTRKTNSSKFYSESRKSYKIRNADDKIFLITY